MARRPGERELSLSPRSRRIAGWVAALGLVIGIAVGVRLVGGTGDGVPRADAPSADATAVPQITFGTALDPTTGLVATPARTSSFGAEETFAYSTADVAPQPTLFVEVERLTPDGAEVVQGRAPQTLPAGAAATAFAVPAAVLLDAFGAGEYRMRIYRAATDERPAAEGTFVLEAISASPGASG